ncbi:MAG TPA: hypothetical protein VGG97_20505 [Bryobacteraceae bacterium]|jgi:hypothetical protein
MSRRLIQCLMVVTMLASILHGQCLLACSLQMPAHATAALNVPSGEHSCCPHQSDQKSQNSEKPCRTDSAAISPSANEVSVATNIVLLPVVLLDQPRGALLPSLNLHSHPTPAGAPDSSSLSLLSSISILRI